MYLIIIVERRVGYIKSTRGLILIGMVGFERIIGIICRELNLKVFLGCDRKSKVRVRFLP